MLAAAGLAAVIIGYGGRYLLRRMPKDAQFIALNTSDVSPVIFI